MHALVKECCDVIQPKAAEAGISIQMNFSSQLPPIHADVDKIKQVLLNLLNNALKYNDPNGSIIIKSWSDDERITISVQDTGLGIPKKDLPHIFEKFYRVQQTAKNISGTGLGLSICKRIIEGHNGNIHVESELGKGSTFIFDLPINFVGIPTKDI
jgi:signal transduction histidine kinase